MAKVTWRASSRLLSFSILHGFATIKPFVLNSLLCEILEADLYFSWLIYDLWANIIFAIICINQIIVDSSENRIIPSYTSH